MKLINLIETSIDQSKNTSSIIIFDRQETINWPISQWKLIFPSKLKIFLTKKKRKVNDKRLRKEKK